jgi:hypothetical protein
MYLRKFKVSKKVWSRKSQIHKSQKDRVSKSQSRKVSHLQKVRKSSKLLKSTNLRTCDFRNLLADRLPLNFSHCFDGQYA